MSAYHSISSSSSASFAPVTPRDGTVTPVTVSPSAEVSASPLGQLEPWEQHATLRVLRSVSQAKLVPIELILRKDHRAEPSSARHLAMYLLRTGLGMSYDFIGRIFGQRQDTVRTTVRLIGHRAACDPNTRNEIEGLHRAIAEEPRS